MDRSPAKNPLVVRVCLDYVPRSGGTSVSLRNFALALTGKYRLVTINFAQPENLAIGGASTEEEEIVRVPVAAGTMGRLYSWAPPRATRACEPLIRGASVVFIHMLYRYHAQWADAFARKSGVPTVVVPHGSLDPYVFSYRGWQKKLWLRTAGRRVLGGASRIVFASMRESQKAGPHVGQTPSEVIAWPVAAAGQAGEPPPGPGMKERLGIAPGERILLYVGRLHPSKRTAETVQAFARSAPPQWHLVMIGPESAELSYAHLRSLRGEAAPRIHVLGPIFGAEKEEYLQSADAAVVLSHKENFGYSVAEALAFGVPVVVSTGVDICGEIESRGCGWVVDASQPREVDRLLSTVFQAPADVRRQMGEAGRRWVQTELTFARFSRRVNDLVESVLKSRGHAAPA